MGRVFSKSGSALPRLQFAQRAPLPSEQEGPLAVDSGAGFVFIHVSSPVLPTFGQRRERLRQFGAAPAEHHRISIDIGHEGTLEVVSERVVPALPELVSPTAMTIVRLAGPDHCRDGHRRRGRSQDQHEDLALHVEPPNAGLRSIVVILDPTGCSAPPLRSPSTRAVTILHYQTGSEPVVYLHEDQCRRCVTPDDARRHGAHNLDELRSIVVLCLDLDHAHPCLPNDSGVQRRSPVGMVNTIRKPGDPRYADVPR